MELACSLPCLKVPSTVPYPEPDESNRQKEDKGITLFIVSD
jgi:hypothetical protein